MGWVTGISDQGYANAHPMSVSYGYDANGNTVTTTSSYTTLVGNGTTRTPRRRRQSPTGTRTTR